MRRVAAEWWLKIAALNVILLYHSLINGTYVQVFETMKPIRTKEIFQQINSERFQWDGY